MSTKNILDILDLFNLSRKELTVQEIANLLDKPKSSIYRYLKVLKDRRYIIETQHSHYKLGYRILEMGNVVKSDNDISIVIHPIMKELTNEINETTVFVIHSEFDPICLATVPSNHPIKVSTEEGKAVPLHAGASSKAILAFLPDNTVNILSQKGMLKKYTENTISDVEKLKKEINQIRLQGYAVSNGELDTGVLTYAVPVWGMNNIIGSLSIAGPRERMVDKEEEILVKHLQKSAKKINETIFE